MKKYTLYQGNLFDEPVEFTYTGFDFTDCVIECQLRENALKNTVVHEFVITPTLGLGTATFRLTFDETVSEGIKIGQYVGDLKISRVSPPYGPKTVASIMINVIKPITRD